MARRDLAAAVGLLVALLAVTAVVLVRCERESRSRPLGEAAETRRPVTRAETRVTSAAPMTAQGPAAIPADDTYEETPHADLEVVVLRPDGSPSTGAAVHAYSRYYHLDSSNTGPDRSTTLSVPQGRPLVVAVLPWEEGPYVSKEFVVPAEGARHVVRLEPGLIVEGVLFDAWGLAPLRQHALVLTKVVGAGVHTAGEPFDLVTDKEGRFHFEELAPGDVPIVTGDAGQAGAPRSTVVQAGETDAVIRQVPRAWVHFFVQDATTDAWSPPGVVHFFRVTPGPRCLVMVSATDTAIPRLRVGTVRLIGDTPWTFEIRALGYGTNVFSVDPTERPGARQEVVRLQPHPERDAVVTLEIDSENGPLEAGSRVAVFTRDDVEAFLRHTLALDGAGRAQLRAVAGALVVQVGDAPDTPAADDEVARLTGPRFTLDLREGDRVTRRATLRRGGALHVLYSMPPGVPVSIDLALVGEDGTRLGGFSATPKRGDLHEWIARPLLPGPWRLVVTRAGSTPTEHAVTIVAGETTELRLGGD